MSDSVADSAKKAFVRIPFQAGKQLALHPKTVPKVEPKCVRGCAISCSRSGS